MHLHVDCSEAYDVESKLTEIANVCDKMGWPSKVTSITRARQGTHLQHPEYELDYSLHTPELKAGKETFASYLTVLLSTKDETQAGVLGLCHKARQFLEGSLSVISDGEVVVEIERVSAVLKDDIIRIAMPAVIGPAGKNIRAPFELHHFVDFSNDSGIEFDEWIDRCGEGILVGGWFQFDKVSGRSFRSVRFARSLDLFDLTSEARAIERAAKSFTQFVRTETVVEQILDIWRLKGALH